MDIADAYEKMFHEPVELGISVMKSQAGRFASMSRFVDDGVGTVPAFDLSGSTNSKVTLTERDFARFAFFAALGARQVEPVYPSSVDVAGAYPSIMADVGPVAFAIGTRVYHRRADGFAKIVGFDDNTEPMVAVVEYEWPWKPDSRVAVPVSELCFDFDAPQAPR